MSKIICHKRDCAFVLNGQCTLDEIALYVYPGEDRVAACAFSEPPKEGGKDGLRDGEVSGSMGQPV